MSELILRNVTLDYPIYGSAPRMLTRKLLSLASAGKINDKYNTIRALDDVTLNLQPGDRLGVVGGNGAGKTTLLRTLAGIYHPTRGIRQVKGKITTLISSGFGMDAESTGYQNIILAGIAMGYTKEQMKSKFEDIERFTELGGFLRMPIKTYSAGMRLRLAFAVSTSIDPEILIIDEGIGAGDAEFYKKAIKRIKVFLNKASILVIASHADGLLKQFCNKGIHMEGGKVVFEGSLESTLKHRNKQLLDEIKV